MPKNMPKNMKAKVESELVASQQGVESESLHVKLTVLLKAKTPGIFDREPAPAFNGNLNKLVESIINLFLT